MAKVVRQAFHRDKCKWKDSHVPISECPCDCFEVVERDWAEHMEQRVKDLSAALLLAQNRLTGITKAINLPEVVATVAEIDRVLRQPRSKK